MEQFLLHSLPVSVTEQSLVMVLRHESSNQTVQSKDQAPEKTVVFQTYLLIKPDFKMRLKILASVIVLASTLVSACETLTSSNRVIVSSAEKWALLPVVNLSNTPLAGSRARALVETHLRSRGVKNLEVYQAEPGQSVLALLDEPGQLNDAKNWAIDNGYRYGITGDVHEWQYKNGLDNEPSVAMTLKFVDLETDEVVWVATAARTGWGYSNLSGTASKTIDEMFAKVKFNANSRARPSLAAAKPTPSVSGRAATPKTSTATAPIRPKFIKRADDQSNKGGR